MWLPVNQMLPSLSSTRPCGPVCGVLSGYSLICPVLGSRRPSLPDSCPVYQIAPSLVASGSCGREPGVGTGQSLIAASTGPAMMTAAGRGRSGEFLIRYCVSGPTSAFGTGMSKLRIMRTTVVPALGRVARAHAIDVVAGAAKIDEGLLAGSVGEVRLRLLRAHRGCGA